MVALRKAGAYVSFLNEPCDLLVGYQGRTILFEIKDGDKPPSARKLTPNEQKFHDEWTGGSLHIVTCIQEAIDVLMASN